MDAKLVRSGWLGAGLLALAWFAAPSACFG